MLVGFVENYFFFFGKKFLFYYLSGYPAKLLAGYPAKSVSGTALLFSMLIPPIGSACTICNALNYTFYYLFDRSLFSTFSTRLENK